MNKTILSFVGAEHAHKSYFEILHAALDNISQPNNGCEIETSVVTTNKHIPENKRTRTPEYLISSTNVIITTKCEGSISMISKTHSDAEKAMENAILNFLLPTKY